MYFPHKLVQLSRGSIPNRKKSKHVIKMLKLHIAVATTEYIFDFTVFSFKLHQLLCTVIVNLRKNVFAPALRSSWAKII